MRSVTRVLAVLLVVGQVFVGSVAIAAEGDFIVDGGGWGHGVGMSQYGAYGMALDGKDRDEILGYYYSGATVREAQTLGTVPGWVFEPQALAVNVASNRTSLEYRVTSGSIDVCHRGDGAGPPDCNGPADETVVAGQRLRVTIANEAGTRCERALIDGSGTIPGSVQEGNCSFDLTWDDAFDIQPSTLVAVEELRYARGPMEIRPNTTGPTFDTVVMLGLEEYLYGIAEVFLDWPAAALEAQAIAARSYAVRTVTDPSRGGTTGTTRLADCGCHIRRTPADQNYDAFLGANPGVVRWRTAVDDTRDMVVTHPQVGGGSEIVTTYYSSSTGGWTENVEDVFGSPPSPHLRSREDPWSVDPSVANPFATWEQRVTKQAAASYLGWDEVRAMELVAGPPGSVVRFRGIDAGSVVETTRGGWIVRNAFGLRSPYISDITKEGPPPPPFTDIDASVHYDDIGVIWRADITKGCNPPDNTLFCPGQAVTRQQMASFLVRALDLPRSEENRFVDDGGSVHESDIDALAAAGITRGCNPPANDRFCPERPVTRGEMAAFLVRAFEYSDPGPGDLFADDDDSIFAGDIDMLATAGVTKGCNPPANDRFCPLDPVTREQMASFLARALR